MRHLARFLAAVFLFSAQVVFAQETDDAPPPQSHEELIAALTQTLEASEIPGAQVVLIEDGQVSLSFSYGVSDREAGTPVTEETVFRAGSVSKSFIGVAFMMAVEDGLLSLDTPVADATPDVEFINPWEATDPLTLAHVMEHTGGFYDITLAEFLLSQPGISIAEGLGINPSTRVSRWRPGTYFSYANSGPAIAAHAIELAREQDYDSLLRDAVLRPLGMEISDLELTLEIEARLSRSYTASLEEPIPYFHILMRPAGALNTTARELAQFVRMLIGRGQVDGLRLLSPESVDRIERSETLEAVEFYGLDTTYGLGNNAQYFDEIVLRGHGGAIDGFMASYAYSAELGVGFVVMVNADDGETVQAVMDQTVGYLLRDFEPDLPPVYERDPAEIEAYKGFYVPRYGRSRGESAILAFSIPTHVSYSDEEYLVVADLPRVANGEHTMRTLNRAESSFALALDSTYRRELRYSSHTMVQLPLWQVALRLVLSYGVALGAAMALGYEIVRFLIWMTSRLFRVAPAPRRTSPPFMRSSTVFAGLSVATIGFIIFDLTSMHYTHLGQFTYPSPVAVTIFVLTIAAPLFAALGLWAAIFGEGEAGKIKRGYHIMATGLILGGFLWLSQWGWIGLRVWTF